MTFRKVILAGCRRFRPIRQVVKFHRSVTMPGVAENSSSEGVKVLPPPVTFKTDKKEYKSIQLPNGLRALLIADARAVDLKELDEVLDIEKYPF